MRRLLTATLILVVAALGVWLSWPGDMPTGDGLSAPVSSAETRADDLPALPETSGDAPASNATSENDRAPTPEEPTTASDPWPDRQLEPYEVVGRVVHAETGEPVAGATVVVLSDGESLDWSSLAAGGLETDAAGRFDWGPAEEAVRVAATKPGIGCTAWHPMRPDRKPIVLRLHPGNVVAGVVRNSSSRKPAHGATVMLRFGFGDDLESDGPYCELDGEGRYHYAGFPPGSVVVPVVIGGDRYAGGDVTAGWNLGVAGQPTLADLLARGRAARFDTVGETARIDLEVDGQPGVEVTYALVAPAEAPLPARCGLLDRFVRSGGASSISGAAGTLTDGRLEVTHFLGLGRHHLHFWTAGYEAILPARTVERAGPPERARVQLRRVPPVVVQLVDAQGRPLPRAGVKLTLVRQLTGASWRHGQPWQFRSLVSDARGRADISPGFPPVRPMGAGASDSAVQPWLLLVHANGDGLFPTDPRSKLAAALRIEDSEIRAGLAATPAGEPYVLRVPAREWMALRVRVIDQDGRPVVGLRVRARPDAAFAEPRVAESDGDGYLQLRFLGVPKAATGRAARPRSNREQLQWLWGAYVESLDPRRPGILGCRSLNPFRQWRVTIDQVRRTAGRQADLPAALRVAPDTHPEAVILKVAATRLLRVRFIDRHGGPIANETLAVGLAATTEMQTDGQGWADVVLPMHASPRAIYVARAGATGKFRLPIDTELREQTIVCYQIWQRVKIDWADGRNMTNPGGLGITAQGFDGEGSKVAVRDRSFGRGGGKGPWNMHVTAPHQVRRIVLTYRDQELAIDLPDGTPIDAPLWKLRR